MLLKSGFMGLLFTAQAFAQSLSFVQKSGDHLTLDGKQYNIAGANCYWLGLDENVIPNPSYPSKQRIDELFQIAKNLGINTIRAHTLGVSTGNALSLLTGKGQYNEKAFEAIDYAIYAARQFGVRLIVPFTDNYRYYHGGKFDFLRFNGLSTADGNAGAFYTNENVVKDFEDYIRKLLTHKNPYTNLTYAEDPIIIAWETGNELGGPTFQDKAVPVSWTNRIATLTKSLAPKHLFIDGTYGINTGVFNLPNVDIVSNHYWPTNTGKLSQDVNTVRGSGKLYLIGEYDWTKGDLPQFFQAVESYGGKTVIGDMVWFLMGRDDTCSYWVPHEDGTGTTLHYPGSTRFMQERATLIRSHMYKLRGESLPPAPGAPQCPVQLPGGTVTVTLPVVTSTSAPTPGPTSGGGQCQAAWAQCGGINHQGSTSCCSGTCKFVNDWYSQCTP